MPTEKIPPSRPIASSDIPWTEWSDVPRFAVRYRHLSLAALGDSYRVGVAIEELPPGKQSSPAHWHVFEEEHLFLLEGRLTLRIGAETRSEEHTSELTSLMRISYAVLCLKKKKNM